MKRARKSYAMLGAFVVGLTVVAIAPVRASDEGAVGAALVRQSSYRHYLDDMLYTHEGDARGLIGPEHDPARDNIEMLFESFGLPVELHAFQYSGQTYYNVVAEKVGTVYPEQVYIIGAHYDSYWSAYPQMGSPGADDNASGVALVLEAARILAPYDSDVTIRFIAFDREEQGLRGARAYAQDHIMDDIVAMVSADMVAYNRGTNTVDIYGLSTSSTVKQALADAVETYGNGLIASIGGSSTGSDHWAFEERGFAACLMIEEWGNPYYHDAEDNVDMPDYLDYAFAVRATRSAVGWLVDNAGVHVPIPDADYDDDGFVDFDDYVAFAPCFSGEDVPPGDPECLFFDFDGDGDVDCVDWDLFAAMWTGPGELPVFAPCDPRAPTVAGLGNRHLVVTAPGQGVPTAFLITGDPSDPAVSCVSQYVRANGELGETPVYRTPEQWGSVEVYGEAIRPSTWYRAHAVYENPPGSPIVSSFVTASTERWGDTVGPYDSGQGRWRLPDGRVDMIDVVAIIDRFRGLPTAPPVAYVDLIGLGQTGIGCSVDGSIDIIDAVGAVDAFKAISFEASTGCPSPCAGR